MANTPEITIVAGKIKEVPKEVKGKKGETYTYISKQEMYGAGDNKAYQVALEELKKIQEAEQKAKTSTSTSKTKASKFKEIDSLLGD